MNIIFSIEQLEEVAQKIIANNPKKVILFHGEMGVGKTTLIKQLCKTLGVTGPRAAQPFL
jgi:tRNA threonylcarbamoyladenosine biosynthesis protein TsaE